MRDGIGARIVARAILATRTVDRAHQLFDRVRSRAVVRWASPAVLTRFNAIAYTEDETYQPEAQTFRSRLFPWEAVAIRAHFPAPPGRVLVGGAGGGREAFALAELGYEVVAFEPADGLAAAMAATARRHPSVATYRAGYEDMPLLAPAGSAGPVTDLRTLAPFCAGILGWGSFSHLPTRRARAEALAAFAAVTAGPVLLSFLAFRSGASGRQNGQSNGRGEAFSVFIGYYHCVHEDELAGLAREAGLEVVELNTDETDSPWPHAILRRREDGAGGRDGIASVSRV